MTEKPHRERDTVRDATAAQSDHLAKPLHFDTKEVPFVLSRDRAQADAEDLAAAAPAPIVEAARAAADDALNDRVEAAGPGLDPDLRWQQLATNEAFAELMDDLAATAEPPPPSERREQAEIPLPAAPKRKRTTERLDTLSAEDYRKRHEIYQRLTSQFCKAIYDYQKSLLPPGDFTRFRERFPDWDSTYPLLFEHGVRIWQGERYRRAQMQGGSPNDVRLEPQEFGDLFRKQNPLLHRRMVEGWVPEAIPSTSLEPRPEVAKEIGAEAPAAAAQPRPAPEARVIVTDRARPNADKAKFKGEPTLLRMQAVRDDDVAPPPRTPPAVDTPIVVPQDKNNGLKIGIGAAIALALLVWVLWPRSTETHGETQGNGAPTARATGTLIPSDPVGPSQLTPPLPTTVETAEPVPTTGPTPGETATAVVKTARPTASVEASPPPSATASTSATANPFFQSKSGSAATGFFDRP